MMRMTQLPIRKRRITGTMILTAILVGSSLLPSLVCADDAPSVVVKGDDVTAKVALSGAKTKPGGQVGVTVSFDVAPGWHIYGEPLPTEFTTTKVKFDDQLLQNQAVTMPKPTPLKFESLGETYPVYTGKFDATGKVALKPSVAPGDYKLSGMIEFQECNDNMCKMPQSLHFEVPVTVAKS